MQRWAPTKRRYDAAILSVGSNDDVGSGRSSELRQHVAATIALLRTRAASRRVIWLLPYERERAYVVRQVAASFGDEVLDLVRFPSRDGVHPVSYGSIAKALLR